MITKASVMCVCVRVLSVCCLIKVFWRVLLCRRLIP